MRSKLDRLYTGLAAGVVAVASSFAVTGSTPAFVVAPISGFVVASTPSAVITFAILVLGSLGAMLGFVLATVLTVGLFGGIGMATSYVADRRLEGWDADLAAATSGAALALLLAYGLTGAFLSAIAAGGGVGVSLAVIRRLLHSPSTSSPSSSTERRRFLGSLVGVVGFTGLAYVLGRDSDKAARAATANLFDRPTVEGGETRRSAVDQRLAEAREKSLDVQGIPGLTTEMGEFYEVDINSIDPNVDADGWTLSVTGAVANPVEITYEELTRGDPEHRFVTLRCVGESLNGHKMDNALWTGVSVDDLLETADPQGAYVMVRAADGYYEEFPLEALRGSFLAYGMNGEVLPRGHGYPVRLLVPGHWGEINVKWVDEIEVLTEEVDGYWEERGWHGTGPVNTVAKLWAKNQLDDGRFEVAGHAYAGTRGIESVEVSTDGGTTWNRAELSEPLPDEDVWRQWRYAFEPEGDTVDVVVRATDGTGTLQPQEDAQPFPSGATGWVSMGINIG